MLSIGYLSDLMENDNKGVDRRPQHEILRLPTLLINRIEPQNEGNVRTIHTIYGGPKINRTFNNACKIYT